MTIHLTSANHPTRPSGRQLRASCGTDTLVQLYRGAYLELTPEEAKSIRAHEMHAARTFAIMQRNAGVVSSISAANLHGLPLLNKRLASEVVLTRKHHGTPGAGLRIRRSQLMPEDVGIRYGMPVTTLRRTIIDLADHVKPIELLAATDAAMRMGFDPSQLPTSGRNCRSFAWVAEQATPRAESFAESWCRALILSSRLPMPLSQVTIMDEAGNFVARVDLAWPDLGVCFEFDGAHKYHRFLGDGETSSDVIMREKQRERALLDLGWVVSRAVWADLGDERRFEQRIRADLERAAALPEPRGSWMLEELPATQVPNFSTLLGVDVDAPLMMPARVPTSASSGLNTAR